MAGVGSGSLKTLSGWPLGINNLAKETALPLDEEGMAVSLRAAVNVDLDDQGKPTTRQGRTLTAALPGLHSLWAQQTDFPLMLAAYAGNLVGFDSDLTRTTLTPLASTAPLSYAVAAQRAFYTNGYDCGLITASGARRPWATTMPIGQPNVLAHTSGGLDTGTYQVAITYLNAQNRESGSSLAVECDLTVGQGLRLEQIPQPANADVTTIRVYVTGADGGVLRFVRDVPVGTATLIVGAHVPGAALATQFLEPLPPGQMVGFHMGHQLVFAGRALYWSEALRYGVGNLAANYLLFAGPGTLIASADDGVYLAAGGKTYWMAGAEPKKWQRVRCYEADAVPGSLVYEEANHFGLEAAGTVPVWMAANGQTVAGLPSGRVVELHADRYVAAVGAARAAAVVRERDGVRHALMVLQGGEVDGFAARDVVTTEVWKAGVRLS